MLHCLGLWGPGYLQGHISEQCCWLLLELTFNCYIWGQYQCVCINSANGWLTFTMFQVIIRDIFLKMSSVSTAEFLHIEETNRVHVYDLWFCIQNHHQVRNIICPAANPLSYTVQPQRVALMACFFFSYTNMVALNLAIQYFHYWVHCHVLRSLIMRLTGALDPLSFSFGANTV